MTSTVALFSTQDELEILQKRSDVSDLKLIAVTPEADFLAQEAQLKHTTIEDYYDAAQVHQKGVNAHQTVANICNHLDSLFFSNNPDFSAHNFYYFFKAVYDQLLLSSHIARGLISSEKPQKVLLASLPPLKMELYAEDNEDLIFQTMFLFFKNADIEVEFYKKKSLVAHRSCNLDKYRLQIRSFLSRKKHLLTCALTNYFKRKVIKVFIAQHWSYETCSELNKFFKVYWLTDKNFLKKKASINHKYLIKNFDQLISDMSQYYIFFEIPLFEIIKPRLTFFIEIIAVKFVSLVNNIRAYLRQKKINIVIAAQGQSLEILAATHAAKMLGLPVVWGQHGGLYGYADFPISSYMNNNYSHYFLYTRPTATIASQCPFYIISDAKLLRLYKAKRYGC